MRTRRARARALGVAFASLATLAASASMCPFARVDVGTDEVMAMCASMNHRLNASMRDAGSRWRSCARCADACTRDAYGDAVLGAARPVVEACALDALASMVNLTLRARALARMLECADVHGLFTDDDDDAATNDALRRCAVFVASARESSACGAWAPLDASTVNHPDWARAGARFAMDAKRCVDACALQNARRNASSMAMACDAVSFCDATIGAGCGLDALVAPYEPGTCLLFRSRRIRPSRAALARTNAGGSWCSATVAGSTARSSRPRRHSFVAYVERDAYDDDDDDDDDEDEP